LAANVEGVKVKLTATKSDGTAIDIGYTTSDADGVFRFKWTPPAEDLYKITATFEGSESYWRSYGTTTLMVGPTVSPSIPIVPSVSPSASPTLSPALTPSQLPAEAMILAEIVIAAAAVIAITIIAVALTAILRKRRE